ncbi:hypothetical protein [Pseudonocardia thermophila]|jgi:hypothetical protein|uniref:hypothetical protein n=1 Tax=Pseudonocardia thermophila TaxID=1848 RepID=UPI00248DAE60|nr:hypothetical protein [Pseudonocardia thermophila]
MNTDDRPVAIKHAEHGADTWRSAVHAQLAAAPDHSDFYAITGEIVDTLRSLESLARLIGRQVAGYGDDHVLRDDEPGHDPAERIAAGAHHAEQLAGAIATAERMANLLWSEIGHIAIEGGDEPW